MNPANHTATALLHWLLAVAIALLLGTLVAMASDGDTPDEAELARAVAADVTDAQRQARAEYWRSVASAAQPGR